MPGRSSGASAAPDHGGMSRPLLGYDRCGAGEPLVLLHGFGSTRDDFAALIPDLAREFEVLSLDLPGHGTSPMMQNHPSVAALTDAVDADLDAHGLGRVHVLGNSLGGRIAIELARRQRALSVVSISPSGLGAPLERAHQGTLMITARMINRIRYPWMEEMARTAAGRAALLAGMRAQPWQASPAEALTMKAGFADQRGFWSTLWNAIMIDVPTGLDEIHCPVIVAQGALDVIGAGQTPRYTPLIPRAQFVLLPGGGHAPQSDTPKTIVDLVRRAADRPKKPAIAA
jgi:pimeloyl-ACP methyl ester carboxylesterase